MPAAAESGVRTKSELSSLNQSQQERLAHIDFTLLFNGEAGRVCLTRRFNVAPSVATQDFARYKELAPHNLIYDEKRRLHLKTKSFKPLFSYDVVRTLATLSQGFGDGFMGRLSPGVACEAPYHLNKPSLEVVARLSEAIHRRQAVTIDYVSLSSGNSRRVIVPHTLVDNGLRWHVRGYDRKHGDFRDFVLTRIRKVSEADKPIADAETQQQDVQWNRMVDLELIPHPRLPHPDAIIMDYAMSEGCLTLKLRAALVGYLLRQWNVDCSPQHNTEGGEFHLALRNQEALHGVANAGLAPGYLPERDTTA